MSEGLVSIDGIAAPPRSNGELVFEAPWESRVFGLAVALHKRGVVDFEEFRARLIEEIQDWQADHPGSTDGWSYYEHWLDALQHALMEQGIVAEDEVEARVHAIAHTHEHTHDH